MDKAIILATAGAFMLAEVSAATGGDGIWTFWDNGLSFQNGVSHLTNPRRSILDDFTVPTGWEMTEFHIKYAWADGSTGTGTDLELVFYRDRWGEPDFDDVVAVPTNRTYNETRDPANPNFFGLTVVDIWIEFDASVLDHGTYWVDMHVVGPVNGFQVIGEYPQHRGEPIWVDYEDFGGRQPGNRVFGDDYDVHFIIRGPFPPAPGTLGLLALAGLAGPRRRRP